MQRAAVVNRRAARLQRACHPPAAIGTFCFQTVYPQIIVDAAMRQQRAFVTAGYEIQATVGRVDGLQGHPERA